MYNNSKNNIKMAGKVENCHLILDFKPLRLNDHMTRTVKDLKQIYFCFLVPLSAIQYIISKSRTEKFLFLKKYNLYCN